MQYNRGNFIISCKVIIFRTMLKKLQKFIFQFKQHYNTQKALSLYQQGSYIKLAKTFSVYDQYKLISISRYPLILFLIEQQNVDCLKVFLNNVNYRKQALSQKVEGLMAKPYHLAYLKNNIKIDQLLNQNGFQIGDCDSENRNILHFAAMHNNTALILKGLDNDLNVDSKDSQGMTPLHYAAKNGKKDALCALISQGSKFNILDSKGRYPLHYAILSGDFQCFKLLFNESSELDFSTSQQPIHTACQQQNMKIVNHLLKDNKGNIYRLGANNFSVLHYAVLNNDINILHLLLSYNALKNHQDDYGCTPIHLAVIKDLPEMVRVLMQKNADLKIKAETGLDAIDSAMMMKDSKVYQLLKKMDLKEGKM